VRGQDYESGSTKGKILEFIRNNRNEWLSSDDIYIPVKNEAEKRRVIGWLKRWEKMGIVRKATVKEVVDAGGRVNGPVHFSSYMWKWEEGAEDVGE